MDLRQAITTLDVHLSDKSDHLRHAWDVVHAVVLEVLKPSYNSVRDAIALNTLRNKFEEIYRVHGQGGASYLYQEMMREFDEFIAAQQHP